MSSSSGYHLKSQPAKLLAHFSMACRLLEPRWRSRWNPAPGKFYLPISRVAMRTSESPSYVQLPEVLLPLSASVDDSESRPGSPPYDLPTPHRQLRLLLGLHFFWGQRAYGPAESAYTQQLGQVRLRSVLIGLGVLRMRIRLRNRSPCQPAAAPLGNQVSGSDPLAIPSSNERCETRRRSLLASCGAASIATSRRSNARVSHAIRVWNKPFLRNKSASVRATQRLVQQYVTTESP